MAQIVDRMIRAAKLDPTLFDEVARDETTMGEAITVVLISSAAAGIGLALAGPFGIIAGAVFAVVSWFIWSALAYFVGTTILADPGTNTNLSAVLRVTGYAAAPGVITILGLIPFLGPLANVVANIWMLAAFIVAIRVVMNYQGVGKAIGVCVIGWIVKMALGGLLLMLGFGGLMMMAT